MFLKYSSCFSPNIQSVRDRTHDMTSVVAEATSGNVWCGLLKVLDDMPTGRKPKLVRGDNAFSNDAMTALE
jgi:hypothetical protein